MPEGTSMTQALTDLIAGGSNILEDVSALLQTQSTVTLDHFSGPGLWPERRFSMRAIVDDRAGIRGVPPKRRRQAEAF